MTLLDAIRSGPMRPAQIRIVLICVLLAMIDGYEVVAVPFSMPAIARIWALPNAQVGYLLSAGIFGMAIGAIAISPLADRIGRRRHILLCLSLITLTMAASGFARSFWQLVAIRAVAGVFIGAMISSLNIIVSEYASDRRRGLVMGLYGVGLPLGSALAGFAIAPLLEAYGWHAPFFFGAALTGVMALVVLTMLPESIDFLVQRRPEGALEAYNRIAERMGHPTAAVCRHAPATPKWRSVPGCAQSFPATSWRAPSCSGWAMRC
ncbi:MFS transporter [Haematobacter genomosp. 1]|nr:MFS transporter [Haematobacter genomosp. 1]